MQTLKNLLIIIAGIVAFAIIYMSRDVPTNISYDTAGKVRYAGYLVLALCFLHWALKEYLHPIKVLPESEQKQLLDAVWKVQKKSSFQGGTTLGGICAAFYIFCLFSPPPHWESPTSIYWATFFIVIGSIDEGRTMVKILAQHRADTLKELGEGEKEVTEDTRTLQAEEALV